ncbi:enhanced serine sensitivity protein SseB C-terminal domain-containing protein [Saccharibacillus kuerlensis]|uniref:SseB protein N-terminal domain-containing protein n=1 Tax=Saccharibacillus kuerlensis TaxID=459527 RepID=A0ABQ2LA65_9BACL|nr:enhanced serine sensitivity protein SseB C-terminal domain-containing protein [Saccharibacillus kuerlensis]GGO08121.1 hypothetical protein GCM10010969_37310 [Saccharibacillus kuerlensis]
MGFEPRNELERTLAAAVHDPSRRKEFYEELQCSEIYTLHMGGDAPGEDGILQEKMKVRLPSVEIAGKTYLPVFTSLPMLQNFIDREMRYLSMNAIDLFGLVRGSDVWLNPGGEFGKEFSASEIESLLDGSLLGVPESYTVDCETQVMLGSPSTVPNDLLNELAEVFDKLPNVMLAYNAHYYNPATGEPPHTLIAVEAKGNWEQVVRAASLRSSSAHVPEPPVDFLRLDGTSGFETYFESNCEPFYQKHRRQSLYAR